MLLQAKSGLVAAQAQRLVDTVVLSAALAGEMPHKMTGI
jgi:hypothetical protein